MTDASVEPIAFDLQAWAADVNSGFLFHAARARGIAADQVEFRPRRSVPLQLWLRLRIGRRVYMHRKAVIYCRRGFLRRRWRHVNGKALHVTGNKHIVNEHLRQAGYSVPEGRLFSRSEIGAAREFFLSLGGDACIKPTNGLKGAGVVPHISDMLHFEQAFSNAGQAFENILVEKSVRGSAVRFMFVGGELVATRLDRPASVVGDGTATVAELVALRNEATIAAGLPIWSPIIMDAEADRMLAMAGLTRGSVPGPDMRVFLRATSNIPTGADGIGCPPGLHPGYADRVRRAVEAIPDLVITAVDVMIADPGAPATDSNYWILDVNSAPGIANFHVVREGASQDVAGAIIDWLVAESSS